MRVIVMMFSPKVDTTPSELDLSKKEPTKLCKMSEWLYIYQ